MTVEDVKSFDDLIEYVDKKNNELLSFIQEIEKLARCGFISEVANLKLQLLLKDVIRVLNKG